MDNLVKELSAIPGLKAAHEFAGLDYQKLQISGQIGQAEVKNIAYRLFPNMFDLVEHSPEFEGGLSGIHQLFFVNFLNNYYRLKLKNEEIF